tara:strand:+ start:5007 stop:5423 length:417 start_codon:yes stop_codon:yes gene_type:complete
LIADPRGKVYRRLAQWMVVVILIAMFLPGQGVEAIQSYVHSWWPWPSSGLASSKLPIDKVVHTFLFFLCAILFIRGWRVFRQHWYLVLLYLIILGILTEWLQQYVPGRSKSLGDLLADGVGVVAGVVLALAYLRRRRT